jgi:hypothetical protein
MNTTSSSLKREKFEKFSIWGFFPSFEVREYGTKKAASGGKMVDATAQTEAELKGQLEKIAKNFGGDGGVDMIKFPDFKFVDPTIEVGDIK